MKKDEFTPEEQMARFDAALKKALNVTGPRVGLNPDGSIDVDFNETVKRGKDAEK